MLVRHATATTAGLALALNLGCATVNKGTRSEITRSKERTEEKTLPETEVEISTRQGGDTVEAEVIVRDTCVAQDVWMEQETVTTGGTPRAVGGLLIGASVMAAGSVGLGVGATFASSTPKEGQVLSLRTGLAVYSGIAAAGTLVTLTWAIVLAAKNRPRRTTFEPVERRSEARLTPCNPRPYPQQAVEVFIPEHEPAYTGTTDNAGRLRVPTFDLKQAVLKLLPRQPFEFQAKIQPRFQSVPFPLPETVQASLDATRTEHLAKRADELSRQADEAWEQGRYDAVNTVLNECKEIAPEHRGCDVTRHLLFCRNTAEGVDSGDYGDLIQRWDELDGYRTHDDERVRNCAVEYMTKMKTLHAHAVAEIQRQEKLLEEEERREAAMEAFWDDVEHTSDSLWNYIMAHYMIQLGLTDLSRYQADQVKQAMRRAVCPEWKEAMKEHGKEFVKPAITAYCADNFPYDDLCSNYTGVCAKIDVSDCERVLNGMCSW